MKSMLDQLEDKLQTLIESSTQLLPASLRRNSLVHRLVEAVSLSLLNREESNISAHENIITIYLNPSEMQAWQAKEDFFSTFSDIIHKTVLASDIELTQPPTIHFEEKIGLPSGEFMISTAASQSKVEETAVLPVIQPKKPDFIDPRPKNAFLITGQSKTIPLRQTVINIGRRLTNHIVLDDPRVSRNHAQLRSVRGKYVLFDLNSTGGTFVNSQRISQKVLNPGDVVSLAGVSLVYGEEDPPELSETSEYEPFPEPPSESK